jgi:extradiol dioxygenase family protein
MNLWTVDADDVPVPHFGVCLSVADFNLLAARLKAKQVKFIVEPHLRFQGKPGEQV